ncbi:MAG: DUF2480 family protein [Bacteroidia bacterium]
MQEKGKTDLIENRVAESGLITIDLEAFYQKGERVLIDIKDQLFRGILPAAQGQERQAGILRENDFREFIRTHDWSQYKKKNVAFTCSADAIVPTWAYMLLAVSVEPFANRYVFGDLQTLETVLFNEALQKVNFSNLKDARVIIKGCGDIPVPVSAYVEATHKLAPLVKSIMYGEACSNVPVLKKK